MSAARSFVCKHVDCLSVMSVIWPFVSFELENKEFQTHRAFSY